MDPPCTQYICDSGVDQRVIQKRYSDGIAGGKTSSMERLILNLREYENDSIRRINELIRQHDFQTALDIAGEFDRYAQDIQEKAREICSEF